MVQKRKVPQRKCVITNEMKAKHDLIRIVRTKEGEVFVDPTGKQSGRGAYLSKDIDVINKAKETSALNRHLKTSVDISVYENIKEAIRNDDEE